MTRRARGADVGTGLPSRTRRDAPASDGLRRVAPAVLGALAAAGTTVALGQDVAPLDERRPVAPASKAPKPWRADQVQRRDDVRPPRLLDARDIGPARRVIMAGDADGSTPDSPAGRVDPNVPDSPWAGVCSLELSDGTVTGLCSATPISPRHVLTAAHCLDRNDDGLRDYLETMRLVFNVDGDASFVVSLDDVRRIELHPDWTGFGSPSLNDDLCIITLAEPLPPSIPLTPVFRGAVAAGDRIEMVGYGQSGSGDEGISVDASLFVKRAGANLADRHVVDDEDGEVLELFLADFDAPGALEAGCFGGASLGNLVETSAAPGDSGGPAFIATDDGWRVFGVNTFISACLAQPGRFGARTGGVVASAYLPWIDLVVECGGNCDDCNGNGVPDGIDLLDGTSIDVDGNGRPDECQPSVVLAGDLVFSRAVDVLVHTPGGPVGNPLPSSEGLGVVRSVAPGPEGFLYVCTYGGVHRIDARSGAYVDHFMDADDQVDRPIDLAWANGRVYVLQEDTGTGVSVTAHDATTGAFVERLVADDPGTPEAEHGGLEFPRRIVVAPDGALLVASLSFASGGVLRFDGRSGAYLGHLVDSPAGDFGIGALELTEHGLWASGYLTTRLLRLDPITGETLASVDVATDPTVSLFDLDVDVDGRLLVLQHAPQDRFVAALDVVSGAFLGEVVPRGSGLIGNSASRLVAMHGVPAAGDVTRDGRVDSDDLAELLMHWGSCVESYCPADVNRDGTVGPLDLAVLLGEWDSAG